ncbi:MAG: hypothetical protein IH933_12120 [Euryarchaeota archaeon]|jgi:hypothetical protein|nr:hypothetical protein [Euryarchaeota archaeon]
MERDPDNDESHTEQTTIDQSGPKRVTHYDSSCGDSHYRNETKKRSKHDWMLIEILIELPIRSQRTAHLLR